MIKRLKPKQRGPWCSFCDDRALYRGYMFGKFACTEHTKELERWDAKSRQPDYSDAQFYGKY